MRTFISLVFLLSVLQLASHAQTSPTPAEIIVNAQKALDADKSDAALALLQPLLAQQPPVKGLQHELGLIYYRTSKLTEAQKAFAEAIKQDDTDKESVQMEGLVLYRLGQQAAAIPYLEKVREWMPASNADASYVLGLCYLNAQRYEDARVAFAKQFGVPPESAGAHLLLATMLKHAKLTDLAGAEAKKALAISPNIPLAHFMLGEVALMQSDVDRAVQEFEAERSINPDYAPLYDRLGDAYLRLGRLDDAQQVIAKAIALDTTITAAFTKMGKVLLRRHEPMTALMYLKHAEKMDPDDYTIHAMLSQAYHLTGQDEEAKRENALALKVQGDRLKVVDPGK